MILFIVGAPGVGKTTAIRSVLDLAWAEYTLPKWTVCGDIAAAGHYTGSAFDGADTIPYNGAMDAVRFWAAHLAPRVRITICDGDRLSHAAVLNAMRATDPDVRCLHFVASKDTIATRRATRGSTQNEAWARGRTTKAARFTALLPTTEIDCNDPDAAATALLAVTKTS